MTKKDCCIPYNTVYGRIWPLVYVSTQVINDISEVFVVLIKSFDGFFHLSSHVCR